MRTEFQLENLQGRDHMGDVGIDGRILLKCMVKNTMWGCKLDSTGSGQSPMAIASCKRGLHSRLQISWTNKRLSAS